MNPGPVTWRETPICIEREHSDITNVEIQCLKNRTQLNFLLIRNIRRSSFYTGLENYLSIPDSSYGFSFVFMIKRWLVWLLLNFHSVRKRVAAEIQANGFSIIK